METKMFADKNVHSSSAHNYQKWKQHECLTVEWVNWQYIHQWSTIPNSDRKWMIATCNYMYESQQIMIGGKEGKHKSIPWTDNLWFCLYNIQKQEKGVKMEA